MRSGAQCDPRANATSLIFALICYQARGRILTSDIFKLTETVKYSAFQWKLCFWGGETGGED